MLGIRRISSPRQKHPRHPRELELIVLRRVIALGGLPSAKEVVLLRCRLRRIEHHVRNLDVPVDIAGAMHLTKRVCDLLDPLRVRGGAPPPPRVELPLAVVFEQIGTEPFHGDHPPVTERAGDSVVMRAGRCAHPNAIRDSRHTRLNSFGVRALIR